MKIEFEKNITGFQEARKLKMILEHYAHSDATDKPTLLQIESLIEQIESFISDPEFESLVKDTSVNDNNYRSLEAAPSFLRFLIASIHAIFGPSKKEMLLSRQRQELLERAERAESMAFDALAETAEIGRERDAVEKKLKETEQEEDAASKD
jgi:hypothetical protein